MTWELNESHTDESTGVTYTAIPGGFRCERDDTTIFVHLNPSLGTDDGVPNIFVYIEDTMAFMGAVNHYDLDDVFPNEKWFVNVYEVSREWGGPEEGGWFYDAGRAVQSHEVPADEEVIGALVEKLRAEFPDAGNRFSAASARLDADYSIAVETHRAADYPTERPHYE